MEIRQKRDEAKKHAETTDKEYREFEAEVWEELNDNPVSGTLKIDLGDPFGVVSFRPSETYYARVIDADAALDYFEERAMLDEMTEPKIVMARANEVVRESIEQAESPPPGLDFYARRFVTITRQKD
jgi:hypothetical protein